jgi:hypothetical protein
VAKYEKIFTGDFNSILNKIEMGICTGSSTATLEDYSNFYSYGHGARCAVRVFERYSYLGGNRVSLNITLFEADGRIHLSAITSGGSQAMYLKFNTFGEEAFLKKLIEIVENL